VRRLRLSTHRAICVHMNTSTRKLRGSLASIMARAAAGEEVVVTRRGRPYVRLLPADPVSVVAGRHPLRGTLVRMAADFDAPMAGLWSALRR